MSWKDYILAFDTETTGFGPDARIIELGFVEYFRGKMGKRLTQRFNPEGVNWEDPRVLEALKINHLTRADLQDCPTFAAHAPHVLALFKRYAVWVGHNPVFDVRMITQEFERTGRDFPEPVGFLADTCSLDFAFNRQGRGWKLVEVMARHGVTTDGELHRADTDAKAAGDIFIKQMELLSDYIDVARIKINSAKADWDRLKKRR